MKRFPVDWPIIRTWLQADDHQAQWTEAFDVCLTTRLETRYLAPIKAMQHDRVFSGEGFSIVTIQCALLEFLAALRVGYDYRQRAAHGVNFEYGSSGRLFREFVLGHEPFNGQFLNEENADSFYDCVRCALVHEAQTKNQWKVRVDGRMAVDFGRKIVDRDKLGSLITAYLVKYRVDFLESTDVRQAFVRKFDYVYRHH